MNNLIYWNELKKELSDNVDKKCREFIRNDCLQETENGWICKPIKGYNSTTYRLIPHLAFGFSCNCQGWNKQFEQFNQGIRKNVSCSHVNALLWKLTMEGKLVE